MGMYDCQWIWLTVVFYFYRSDKLNYEVYRAVHIRCSHLPKCKKSSEVLEKTEVKFLCGSKRALMVHVMKV